MEMSSNFHIAQQSRRDKLRIQNESAPSHHHSAGVNYLSSLDEIHHHHHHHHHVQDNLPYEYCSEMLSFPVNHHHGVLAERVNVMMHHQESGKGNLCRTIPNAFSTTPPAATVNGDPQYFSTWKSIGSQSTPDWVPHQTPIFVGDGLSASSSFKLLNNAAGTAMESHSPHDLSLLYQNPLQELVITSSSSFGLELGHRSTPEESRNNTPNWVVTDHHLRLKSQSDLISRAAEACPCPQWGGQELNYTTAAAAVGRNDDGDLRTVANDNSNTQALSLSLSSVPSPKVQTTQISEKYSTATDALPNLQDSSRIWKPVGLNSARQDLGTQPQARRNPGPLGPFTGYATILRSSKFLRPAQQLLDELSCFARPKDVADVRGGVADKVLGEVRVSSEAVCNGESVVGVVGDSSGSSFTMNDLSDKNQEAGGVTCPTDSFQPENLQKKAKLLYMQDEVCKRYRQYHQQMQMVVTSFESVAGLSAATPYVSLALKMVSKHFRCLKSAISDQLKSLRNALGEDLSSPAGDAGTSSSKGEAGSVSMLKFFDQSLQKQKRPVGGLGGILDGQHIWRPQRGLPERAVSILRAWLFDHFLHPYPTDTDKHMLASQTGLTRNQVSNWFINARVRLWKPMVEEIHMLETKATLEAGSDPGKAAIPSCNQLPINNSSQSFNNSDAQQECSNIRPSHHQAERLSGITTSWNHDKRSRVEYTTPSSVASPLIGLVPGIEIGGLGAVSLTLGLRQSAENAQRPALPQEHHLRPHFGGQIIRDFVG